MAITAFATGTLSTTGSGTEDFLSSPNQSATYVLKVDLNDMASGDVIEVRVYVMVLTGGTARVAYYTRREGLQPADDKILLPVPVPTDLAETNGVRFSITQLAGTAGISLPWSVMKIA